MLYMYMYFIIIFNIRPILTVSLLNQPTQAAPANDDNSSTTGGGDGTTSGGGGASREESVIVDSMKLRAGASSRV